jgi:CRP-like cAMP-binding protein
MKVPFEKLNKMVFFMGLPEEAIKAFAEASTIKSFKKGQYLIEENSEAFEFFIVKSGEVEICSTDKHTGFKRPVQKLGTSEVLGWSWLFSPYIWSFDAIALDDVETIRLDGAKIREFCETQKDIGYDILKRFSKLMSLRLLEVRTKYSEIQEQLIIHQKSA